MLPFWSEAVLDELIASAFGYMVSVRGDFRNMWWIAGALLALSAGAFALTNKKDRYQATGIAE